MRKLTLIALLYCFSLTAGSISNLDQILEQQNLFGKGSKKELTQNLSKSLRFKWCSKDKRRLRSFAPVNASKTQYVRSAFMGDACIETIIHCSKSRVKKYVFNIYTKGDMGRQRYNTEKIRSAISTKLKIKEQHKAKTGINEQDSFVWNSPKAFYRLDAKQREYVTLSVSPHRKNFSLVNLDKGKVKPVGQKTLKKRVKRKKNGDVYISRLPMVDQGGKGYCACATAARILQYYGRDANQHEVADVAKTNARTGSSMEVLEEALQNISYGYRFKLETMGQYIISDTKIYAKYRSLLIKELFEAGHCTRNGKWKNKPDDKTFNKYVIAAALGADTYQLKKFKQNIKKQIDRGQPLAWGLALGIIKEKDIPQASGGHMRIILGYNMKKDELLYTDSWGAGHELKRINFTLAFAPTMALWKFYPKSSSF